MGRVSIIPVELRNGPFTLAEARLAGLTRYHLRGSGWRRLGRDLYMWAGAEDDPVRGLTRIIARLPAASAFSGPTAGWLHGLDMPPCKPIEVTIPNGAGVSARAGMVVRRDGLELDEVVVRRGLRCTSAVRTVADLGRRLPLIEGVVVVDEASRRGLLDLAQLDAFVAAHPGARGLRRLRRAIALAEPRAESQMETRLRLVLVLAGLPRPEAQVSLVDAGGSFIARPDLLYRREAIAIEYDGVSHRDSLAEDNRRQNRLVKAGFRLLRFTAVDLQRTPAAVIELVRTELARGRSAVA